MTPGMGIVCMILVFLAIAYCIYFLFYFVTCNKAVRYSNFTDAFTIQILDNSLLYSLIGLGREKVEQQVERFATQYFKDTGIDLHKSIYHLLWACPKTDSVDIKLVDYYKSEEYADYTIVYTYNNREYTIPFIVRKPNFFVFCEAAATISCDVDSLLSNLEPLLCTKSSYINKLNPPNRYARCKNCGFETFIDESFVTNALPDMFEDESLILLLADWILGTKMSAPSVEHNALIAQHLTDPANSEVLVEALAEDYQCEKCGYKNWEIVERMPKISFTSMIMQD